MKQALILMHRLALAVAFLLSACMDDVPIDSSQFAIDTDHSGTFDCADLDHVNACINHHIADACDLADVNHDGVVDAEDVHDISAALHDSAAPAQLLLRRRGALAAATTRAIAGGLAAAAGAAAEDCVELVRVDVLELIVGVFLVVFMVTSSPATYVPSSKAGSIADLTTAPRVRRLQLAYRERRDPGGDTHVSCDVRSDSVLGGHCQVRV